MSQIRTWSLGIIVFAIFYLIPLTNHGLWIPDETRYAQISQAMLLDGDWISPHFLGLRYFEKPIAGYWMIALGQAIFGDNLFGVRIASLVATALSTLLVYLLARQWWGNSRSSALAALLYASFGLIAGQAGYSNLDPQFTLWVNLSVFALWNALERGARAIRLGYWLLLGFACAMGFLTKGFLALLLPVLIAVPYAAWQKRVKALLIHGPLAIVGALLITLPWALAIHHQEPDYWRFFFWHEHVRRFAGEDAQHAQAWWFYLPLLVVATLPWAGLIPSTLRQAWHERGQPAIAFCIMWFVMPLIFFSLCRGKLPTYIMPCLMPLALVMGHFLAQRLQLQRSNGLRLNAVLNALVALGAGVSLAFMQLHRPVYVNDAFHLTLVWIVIATWAFAALAAWVRPVQYWHAPLMAIWMLIAFLPAAMPHTVVQSKTPDTFIASQIPELAKVRHLVSNDLGVASALAWRLKTPQVTLYDTQGELKYGLSYPEASQRSISADQIQDWLARARIDGPVGVLLRIKSERDQHQLDLLPTEGQRYTSGRLTLVILPQVLP
ncbi:lipid IV(A) 4-amino-4-deoxy-L-arabinosyltransferase [Pseudomonas sp. NPDC008258]|uniref:lipid IV(A) 4-amino-4-deoxy-L-arabinosyltransferase n=1 Tax=Pseudomonas sp. NPDC008258 TaxID=3364418 RepID=UPI0036E9F9F8